MGNHTSRGCAKVAASLILVGVVACSPNKEPTLVAYQRIGSACIAATGVVNTITPMITRGRLTARQISAFGASLDIINPICSAGDIPDYDYSPAILNEQIWLLEDIILNASGG
jgi:hypothetical protein